jgi:autotransporter passenger strand-loop-strand repeat protein
VFVQSGGVATSMTVSGVAAADVVRSGGIASNTSLTSRGSEVVSAGGVTMSALVNTGGVEFVASGGLASAALISGGRLEIASGGSTGSGAVTFATSAGGTLQLDSSLTFSGLVAGFAQPDLLYLKDFAFISGATSAAWTQSGTSGSLAVTNGSQTVDITLLGHYATANFNVSSGTQGGTVVTDPPLAAQTDPAPQMLAKPT